MAPDVFHRREPDSEQPKQIGFVRLRKVPSRASCELWSHPAGWELQLSIDGEFMQSIICESIDEALDSLERWKAGMMARGWQ